MAANKSKVIDTFSNFEISLPAKNRYSFEINNIDLSIINAFRRIILTNIPVVGFDGEIHPTLTIEINDGPLHNEIMLHRFGLIPIYLSETETDEFISDDYEFSLDVHNKDLVIKNVTSHDFKVVKMGTELSTKEVQRLFPVDPITKDPILITRLRPDERLKVVNGRAIKSTASHHAGFSAVSLCTIEFKQDPVESAKQNNVLDKERAYIKNEYGDPLVVLFSIESECALTPKYIFSKAIEILSDKLHKIIQNINVDEASQTFIKFETTENGGQFTFENEDDTLGNFLQSTLHNHYIRENKAGPRDTYITYVGYYCPHPLDNTMVLRINPDTTRIALDKINTDIYKDIVREHSNRMLIYLSELQDKWQKYAI
jgi:DNA-directed RNA polymerase alpha subunit